MYQVSFYSYIICAHLNLSSRKISFVLTRSDAIFFGKKRRIEVFVIMCKFHGIPRSVITKLKFHNTFDQ